MTGKEGVISAFLTGFIFVVLWLTACENLPYNEGKTYCILCAGCADERADRRVCKGNPLGEQTEEFAKEIRWESGQ